MRHSIPQRFRTAMGQLQQIHLVEWRAVVLGLGTISAILSGKRNYRIGEMIDFGQSRVYITLLRFGRRWILRSAAKQHPGNLGLRMAKLVDQPADSVGQVYEHAAASATGRGNDIDARPVIAQGQSRLYDGLV